MLCPLRLEYKGGVAIFFRRAAKRVQAAIAPYSGVPRPEKVG
jgi:hypothetical protein